MRPNLGFESLV